MRSFAVWYELNKGSVVNEEKIASSGCYVNQEKEDNPNNMPKDMLHINFWSKLKYEEVCYFDFGIYVDDLTNIGNIYVYCPFIVDKKNIRDLGARMSNDNLVNALFNENYITTNGNAKRYLIDKNIRSNVKTGMSQVSDKFVIYAIDEDNEIDIHPCKREKFKSDDYEKMNNGRGTIIELKVPNLVGNAPENLRDIKSYYFRFRVETKKSDLILISEEVKSDSWVTDTITTTEVMDFRINDIRSCCDEVRDRFNRGKHFNLKSIHYLIMRDAEDSVVVDGSTYSSRLLEKDVWEKYVDILDKSIVAYHFKEKSKNNNPVSSLVVLVRFRTSKPKLESIVKYFSVAVIVAVLTTVASKGIISLVKYILKQL